MGDRATAGTTPNCGARGPRAKKLGGSAYQRKDGESDLGDRSVPSETTPAPRVPWYVHTKPRPHAPRRRTHARKAGRARCYRIETTAEGHKRSRRTERRTGPR